MQESWRRRNFFSRPHGNPARLSVIRSECFSSVTQIFSFAETRAAPQVGGNGKRGIAAQQCVCHGPYSNRSRQCRPACGYATLTWPDRADWPADRQGEQIRCVVCPASAGERRAMVDATPSPCTTEPRRTGTAAPRAGATVRPGIAGYRPHPLRHRFHAAKVIEALIAPARRPSRRRCVRRRNLIDIRIWASCVSTPTHSILSGLLLRASCSGPTSMR